jgi:hypothetical protein
MVIKIDVLTTVLKNSVFRKTALGDIFVCNKCGCEIAAIPSNDFTLNYLVCRALGHGCFEYLFKPVDSSFVYKHPPRAV